MKSSRSGTIRSLKTSSAKSKLDLSKIKSTDINILLNKVRLDQRNDVRKKIIYFSLIVSAFLVTGLLPLYNLSLINSTHLKINIFISL
jgi:hypothetical protein